MHLGWKTLLGPSLIATLLVVACGGGGGGSSASPVSHSPDDPIPATFIPQEDGIRVEWTNPVELDDNITGIRIVWRDGEGNRSEIELDDRKLFTLGEKQSYTIRLTQNTTYSFTISLIYSNGESEQLASRQELSTGPNYDEDEQIDALDEDDDNDGRKDSLDDCQQGDKNWLSNHTSDYDNDGCRDDGEDTDDDNDGRDDGMDSCSKGIIGWDSRDHQFDTDQDGCRDEDEDDDLIGISNITAIPMDRGVQFYWVNPPVTLASIEILISPDIDFGRIVILEPQQAFNVTPLRNDISYEFTFTPTYAVSSAKGNQSSIHVHIGANYDNDSLADAVDMDDDNDGVADRADHCRLSLHQWLSNDTNDYDSDGCQDGVEDDDHDNDGRDDRIDHCPKGNIGWDSLDHQIDVDQDGCRDSDEDKRLLGVENLRAWPDSGQINLVWRNPSGLIDFINNISIQWSHGEHQQQAAIGAGNTSYLISGLEDHRNWTINITVHYNNGAIGPHSPIQVLTGPNRDRDHLADAVDPDDDGDGVLDTMDDCRDGHISWTSNHRTDHDGDGCRDEGSANADYGEDTDDDNDGREDRIDACPKGSIGWDSHNIQLDTDQDGCRDRDEDHDLVGIHNLTAVPDDRSVQLSWVNPPTLLQRLAIQWNGSGDFGNRSETDQIQPHRRVLVDIDGLDNAHNYTFTITAFYANGGVSQAANITLRPGSNYDNDSLADSLDTDKDNDGIANKMDSCPLGAGAPHWSSNATSDHDGDGCRDQDEDMDDDSDGRDDKADACRFSPLGFRAASSEDYDEDGCRDEDEDLDDDNDGLVDSRDACRFSPASFNYMSSDDSDRDGCRDRDEDDYLASVSNLTAIPTKNSIRLNWVNPPTQLKRLDIEWNGTVDDAGNRSDRDQINALQQGMLMIDGLDNQSNYTFVIVAFYTNGGISNQTSLIVRPGANYDMDGLADTVDTDKDGDGITNPLDTCPMGRLGWLSGPHNDPDRDGCHNDEDDDDDNDGQDDGVDSCRHSPFGFLAGSADDIDGDGCRDRDEDTSLPGVEGFEVIPERFGAGFELSWQNPSFPLSHINISYSVFSNIQWRIFSNTTNSAFIEAAFIHIPYMFSIIPYYANGGKGDAKTLEAQAGVDYDGDKIIDLLDDDDDNDGLEDINDQCDFSLLGFRYASAQDINHNGCRDTEEMVSFPGVTNLTAIPYTKSVDLNWTNPDLPLSHLLVQWGDREQRLPADNHRLLVTQLEGQHTWTFIITPHYINGLSGQPNNITVALGDDYDGDHIIDVLDEDDDNDGVPDKLDLCKLSTLNFIDNPIPQDLNRDGCQDLLQRPNPFGVNNLSAQIINSSAIMLHGSLDYSSSVYRITFDWSWQDELDRVYYDGQDFYDLSSPDGNFSLIIDHLIPETSYSFSASPIYNNGGRGKRDMIDVDFDVDYDKDSLVNFKDADDDNDGLPDEQDSCQFSPLGFHYLSDEDGDRDGCRDRDEDAFLAAVSKLNATPMDSAIELSWINPNGSLTHLTVDWTDGVDSSSAVMQDSLDPLAPATILITGLTDYVNYTVSVTPEYISGVSGDSSSTWLIVEPNHDNDSQVDRFDNDDDNDGIADRMDSCQFGRVNWQSSVINDYDGDGCRNDEDMDDDNDGINDGRDMDDDGDGLIEIDSAEALFNVRYQLDGSGYKSSAGAQPNDRGCGATRLTGISSCFGYELTQAISLADYPNWLPIAGDRDELQSGFQGSAFSAVFDGNHHSISDLTVRRLTSNHQALFGKLDGARVTRLDIQSAIIRGGDQTGGLAGEITNAIISQVDISNSSISGKQLVGGLAGKSSRTSLQSVSSGHNDIVSFYQTSGGLIGSGDQLVINGSGIMHSTILSPATSGGLVANGDDIIIQSSSLIHSNVFGYQPGVGGFVGKGSNIEIYQASGHHSFIVNSDSSTGGLVGQGTDITVDSAHLRYVYVEGNTKTGGLIGDATHAIVRSSSNIASLINGDDNTGGFMGSVNGSILYDVSAINITVDGNDQIGGLIGQGRRSLILASYIQDSSVDGEQSIGGLAGRMEQWLGSDDPLGNQISYPNGTILASTMSGGMISGSDMVGGLVGSSQQAIISTNHVNSVELTGDEEIGGLIGQSFQSTLHASYILNSHLDGSSCLDALIGSSERNRVHASYGVVTISGNTPNGRCDIGSSVMDSYFDSNISGSRSGQLAGPQTSRSLQQPTNYSGIYANWDQLIDLEPGQNSNADARNLQQPTNSSDIHANSDQLIDNVDAISVWCDRDHSGSIEDDERNPTNRIWDFGTQHDYPMGLCHAMSGASAGSQTPDSDNDTGTNIAAVETIIPTDISIDGLITNLQQLFYDSQASQRDPLIDFQWYLDKVGIKQVWQQGWTGAGVDVVLVDTGMEVLHEDLIQNVVIGASRNYEVGENDVRRTDPYPTNAHGTASAGTIAAKGDNGIGIKGLAPDAGIYAYTTGGRSASEYLSSLLPNTPQTAVSANVWGSLGERFRTRTVSYSLVEQTVEEQLAEGFYGRGLSYIIAAHNARASGGSAHYMPLRNHRGFMTICAVGADDTYAHYSNPGANLWICGPSSGNYDNPICNPYIEHWRCQISTTDNSGDAGWNDQPAESAHGGRLEYSKFRNNRRYIDFGGGDYDVQQQPFGPFTYLPPIGGDRSYTRFFGGTSAATPIVSGAIAVLRAAYPHLTWRDVKLIVAESAKQVDKNHPSWQEGAVAYHNHSQRYHHSPDYGFGMINMPAAMSLAAQWRSLPTDLRLDSDLGYGFLTTRIQSPLRVAADRVPQQLDFIEHIDIKIEVGYQNINYEGNFRNMDIVLTSPHGTQSILSRRYPCVDQGDQKCDKGLNWTFGSAAHLGENPVGEWTLSIDISEWDDSNQVWQVPQQDLTYESIPFSWKMTFYGHNSRDMSNPVTNGGFSPSPGDEDLNP